MLPQMEMPCSAQLQQSAFTLFSVALLPATLAGRRGGARSSSLPNGVGGDDTTNLAAPDLWAGLPGVGVWGPRACF